MAMFFIADYYKIVDVRMMKFFTEMTTLTMWVLIALGALSLLYKNFWCRYLCPYGALLGLVSRFSPFKVRRNEEKCIHCHACTKHCPTLIDVEKKDVVKSEECFGCLTCVSRCPVRGRARPHRRHREKDQRGKTLALPRSSDRAVLSGDRHRYGNGQLAFEDTRTRIIRG